ncbi:MAG: hypothetical protein KAI29_04980 [Cyclobacteriaceae bacterium]|nr:hypothetical protein [Cyclobacteriaceae bacterium]
MQEYINVDRRIHLLSQILAKVNRNFMPEKEDFSHTTLSFDALGKRIASHWIKTENGNIALALNLTDFSYDWLDASFNVIKKYNIAGKNIEQLETEIISDFKDIGLGKDGFTKKLKYKIPEYPFKEEKAQVFGKQALDKWIYFRNMANEAVFRFLKHLLMTDEIRIWPHHFDTGVYKDIDGKIGLGFGLAMQDSLVDSPYFYLSGYLLTGQLSFENLPSLKFGRWDTGDWNGAVLPLSEIDDLSDVEKRTAVDEFIKSTLDWYWKSSVK